MRNKLHRANILQHGLPAKLHTPNICPAINPALFLHLPVLVAVLFQSKKLLSATPIAWNGRANCSQVDLILLWLSRTYTRKWEDCNDSEYSIALQMPSLFHYEHLVTTLRVPAGHPA